MKKVLIFVLLFFLVSCNIYSDDDNTITIATTTSFVNTGVLDYLIDEYKKYDDLNIQYLSVGSGKAIELGKADEADILILHTDINIENNLVEDGYTYSRNPFIENEFVLVSHNEKVWENTFVSRGDNSGTHVRELSFWNVYEKPKDYIETGQGMLDTLIITNEVSGTTLIDKGTWIANKEKVELQEFDTLNKEYTRNIYSIHSVITNNLNREKKAKDFLEWVISDETINKIENFGIDKYEESLFYKYKK